jgi:hypothetical protein
MTFYVKIHLTSRLPNLGCTEEGNVISNDSMMDSYCTGIFKSKVQYGFVTLFVDEVDEV